MLTDVSDFWVYCGLFGIAFVAATLVPLQSEAALTGLLAVGGRSVPLLVLTAGAGNILGSVVNWWLGRRIERFRERRWFPIKEERLLQAERWYGRYGRWSLLLSWAPIIGDPLTMVAGVLREPLWSFLLFVSAAKIGRYCIIAAAVRGWLG